MFHPMINMASRFNIESIKHTISIKTFFVHANSRLLVLFVYFALNISTYSLVASAYFIFFKC